MYSYTLPFFVHTDNEKKAFELLVQKMNVFSLQVQIRDSIDFYEGNELEMYLVTFRSQCDMFARHMLQSFYFCYHAMASLPFPESFDNNEFEEDEQ